MIAELGHFALTLAFAVALFQAVVPLVGAGKLTRVRRSRNDLELGEARATLAVRRARAVAARVAAADDDHVFSGGQDLIGNGVSLIDLVLLRQKLHGVVNAG